MIGFKRLAVGFLATSIALCGMHAASAATRTASISVSATVVASCGVEVSVVAGTGSARCSQETAYRFVTSTAAADVNLMSDSNDGASSSDQAKPQNAETRAMVMTFTF